VRLPPPHRLGRIVLILAAVAAVVQVIVAATR
jgi:hypothetical protein